MDIGINLYTHHTDDAGLCNQNPGVYVKSESGWAGGVLKNSECRLGAWGAYSFETNTIRLLGVPASAGLMVGGITGYRAAPLLPLIAPSVKVSVFRFTYLPKAPGAQSDGIHLSIEKKF